MKLSRKLYLPLFFLLFIVIAAYGYSLAKNAPIPKQKPSTQSNKLTELKRSAIELKDPEAYYRVYKEPSVVYLRKALNAYLVNDSNSGIATTAIRVDRQEDTIGGLDAFDKDYYNSKFVVLALNDSLIGGKEIQIIFQDKPDRVFNAWVYKLAGGEYELRSFYSKGVPEQTIKDLVEDYKQYVFDKEHAL